MEQHAVPQNISSYQFHLVGDMTLKQFLELAAGVVVGVILYATGLPGIIKWPLILFSAGMGAALAFVPLEERPLEQWIVAFFRGVYSPTLFHWEKRQGVKYFAEETQPTATAGEQNKTNTNAFASIPFLSKLEASENNYLSKLTGLFTGSPTSVPQSQVPVKALANNDNGMVLTMHGQQNEKGVTNNAPVTEAKHDVIIPQTTYISIDKQNIRPQMILEETPHAQVNLQTTSVSPTLTSQGVAGQTKQAMFSLDAAPPSVPTIVNTVSGQVMDHNKKIIEGAILEITDENGRPVRALRTNRAGHFLIVTALLDGKYKLLAEKEGQEFDPIEFEASGAIIEPIAIQAK